MNASWPALPIHEVCESIVDCVNKTAPLVEELTPYKMIRTTNVRDGWVSLSDTRRVSAETFEKWTRRQVPKRGDVILAREAPLGAVGILRSDETVFLGQRLVSYRARAEKLHPCFLLYSMMDADLQGQILSYGSGATVAHMRVPDASNLKIRIPPLPTQRRIASILSAYDDLIENNTKRIEILEEMARSLYREWFVHFRFPGHEKVKLVDSELGKIPEGWTARDIGSITANYDRQRKPLSSVQRAKMQGPFPYYGAAKIFDHVDDYIFDGRYLLMAEDGSVVTKDRRPVLQIATGKFWVNNHTHVLRGLGEYSTDFVYLTLDQIDITPYITGAAQPKINQANMNRIPVLAPTVPVLSVFDSHVRPMLAQVDLLSAKNAILRQTRDLLLPKLISGAIDVDALDLPEAG